MTTSSNPDNHGETAGPGFVNDDYYQSQMRAFAIRHGLAKSDSPQTDLDGSFHKRHLPMLAEIRAQLPDHGNAGPGMEGDEYDEMVRRMQERLETSD